jgi:hypothetical protein
MPETSPERPFQWSEIHSQVKEKLDELDKAIRAEIRASLNPLPTGGGARHQFFVLLEEKANDWADRAERVYWEYLSEIGRDTAPGVRYAVWYHGFTFFIGENIRQLMFLSCGMGAEEKRLLGFVPYKNYPTPSNVLDLRATVRELYRIIERISKARMTKTLNLAEGWPRLIAEEIKRQQQAQSSTMPVMSPVETLPAQPTNSPADDVPDHTVQPAFELSDDCVSVRFRGESYTLTKNQAAMMAVLWDAHRKRNQAVGKDKLLQAIENETSEVRDSWRRSPLWKTLIVSAKKGAYRLSLPLQPKYRGNTEYRGNTGEIPDGDPPMTGTKSIS